MKKILFLFLFITNTVKPVSLEIITGRREFALTVLSKSYKDLGQTVTDIEQVEDALKKSHAERKTEMDKKLRLSLSETIRFLESARRRLDKIEEKQNPLYYYRPAVYVSKDYSYDTLIKNRKDSIQVEPASSKSINMAPKSTYKLIIFIFIMSLLLDSQT